MEMINCPLCQGHGRVLSTKAKDVKQEQPAPVTKFRLWWRVDQHLPVRVYDRDGKSFWTELDDVACANERPVEPDEKWAMPCTLPAPPKPAPVVPDRAGWWWRKDCHAPQFVALDDGTLWWGNDCLQVANDGQWLGPCVKPEVSDGKP